MVLQVTSIKFYLSHGASAQRIIAEFPSKNKQLNFQAIPVGDGILFSYDEVVGPNCRRVRDGKWVSNAASVHDIFCPVNVFAIAVKDDKVNHYYHERKIIEGF